MKVGIVEYTPNKNLHTNDTIGALMSQIEEKCEISENSWKKLLISDSTDRITVYV